MYVLSLNPSGRELIVDKTFIIQHGYQGEGAKTTGTGKDVFVRSRTRRLRSAGRYRAEKIVKLGVPVKVKAH